MLGDLSRVEKLPNSLLTEILFCLSSSDNALSPVQYLSHIDYLSGSQCSKTFYIRNLLKVVISLSVCP
jgi:hypothetical protein